MKRLSYLLFVFAVLGAVVYPGGTFAQNGEAQNTVWAAGSVANLFESLDADRPIAGVRLRVPAAWDVEAVYLLRYGTVPVPIDFRTERDGSVLVSADMPIQGPHELVARVRLGGTPGTFRWQVTPYEWVERGGERDTVRQRQYLAAQRRTHSVEVERDSEPDGSNLALDLGGTRAPLLFRPRQAVWLGRGASFTIEFWMRTGGLDEVILSTWTGDEERPYPAEFTVDQSGRLRFYCGRSGRHQALRSMTPVADDKWHHAAVVYDNEVSRIQLMLDGRVVDSVQARALPRMSRTVPVAIGGRRPATLGIGGATRPYTGQLDEIRIWPRAQSEGTIRRMKGRPFAKSISYSDGPARLSFDEDAELDDVDWPSGARRVPASLSFRSPLRALRARTEDRTVTLRWKTDAADEGRFIVERSPDGTSFQPVDRVDPVASSGRSESQEVVYTDEDVSGQIVYYRIRQVSSQTGVERTTGTVKIGLGAEEDIQKTVELVGNFPNPFEESTTIAYRVTEPQPVTLTIWDLSGKRVSTLATGMHDSGYYEKTLTAQDLPSGTYFARLETGRDIQSHRLVLVK